MIDTAVAASTSDEIVDEVGNFGIENTSTNVDSGPIEELLEGVEGKAYWFASQRTCSTFKVILYSSSVCSSRRRLCL